MKRIYALLLALPLTFMVLQAQSLNKEAFALLNLDYPGLEQVKEAYGRGNWKKAAQALLDYFRQRAGVVYPALDLNKVTLSPTERKWADEALEHTFFVHTGYQPSFNYGKDIDWKYWPVRDNELRWQLHRHKWFIPMGKAYRVTGDEKYAREWVLQYVDWIRKNPLVEINPDLYELADVDSVKGEVENVRFAWRPLETGIRLKDQIDQFLLFLPSRYFTPAFLTEFLVNYHKHAVHVQENYSAEGNHLLFEAQYVLNAGIFFPEFAEASRWRQSGIDVLNREIRKQVYADGGQYELDLGYHAAAIDIFSQALSMADANGFREDFPDSYVETIHQMMHFYLNTLFPDYTVPCFSDGRRSAPYSFVKSFKRWSAQFPDDEQLRYFATQGKEGRCPIHLSYASPVTGFFTLRNGWKEDATVMVLKAGPKGEWHCQPDNGTFELWSGGKNLFPDSGCYVFGGDEEVWKQRNWFRQTAVHNTLTLDNRNLETTQSVTRLWKAEGDTRILVTENPGYSGLLHRRSVFFVRGSYFVLVDEAIGPATGTVNLHYQLCDGAVEASREQNRLTTHYDGESNVRLQCFSAHPMEMVEEEGWYSVAYRERIRRPAFSFNVKKNDENPVRYVTVICPRKQADNTTIHASLAEAGDGRIVVEVEVDGQKDRLYYNLAGAEQY